MLEVVMDAVGHLISFYFVSSMRLLRCFTPFKDSIARTELWCKSRDI